MNLEFEGVAAVGNVDLADEQFTEGALNQMVEQINKVNAEGGIIPLFLEFRRGNCTLPLGKVERAWLKDSGMYITGCISKYAKEEVFMGDTNFIKGMGLGIGGDALELSKEVVDGKKITVINKIDLKEISLVRNPTDLNCKVLAIKDVETLGGKNE